MWDSVRRHLRRQRMIERRLPGLRPGQRDGHFPLSAAQQRMWHLVRPALEQGSAYNVTYATRLYGPIDHAALRRAVHDLIGRHDALRTAFVECAGEPAQVVCPDVAAPVEIDDLAGVSGSGVDDWLADAADHQFRLADGRLFRVRLGQLAAEEYIAVVVGHHIVLDGRSMAVILREIGQLYTDHLMDRPRRLEPVRVQFGDFVMWQRDWLGSSASAPFLAHWHRQLTSPAFARFAAGVEGGPGKGIDPRGGRVTQVIPQPVVSRVRRVAAADGISAGSLYLAAYQALLHLHTDREYLVTGIPAANRGRPELATVVGFLVNVLPVASARDSRLTLRDVSRDAEAAISDAYAYQAMPIEYAAPLVLPGMGRTAVPIDTFFVAYRQVLSHPLSMPDVTVGPEPPIRIKDVEIPIMMRVTESATDATAMLAHGEWAFSAAAARTLCAAYVALLDLATAQPDRPLGELTARVGSAC